GETSNTSHRIPIPQSLSPDSGQRVRESGVQRKLAGIDAKRVFITVKLLADFSAASCLSKPAT
ncbi:hypothetical protein N8675_04575, partial [Akkermansiaceae bacterium]|nr:hypothetical protein [Akkermansiaceae bacterium]